MNDRVTIDDLDSGVGRAYEDAFVHIKIGVKLI